EIQLSAHIGMYAAPFVAVWIRDQNRRKEGGSQPLEVEPGSSHTSEPKWRQDPLVESAHEARAANLVQLDPRKARIRPKTLHIPSIRPVVAEIAKVEVREWVIAITE